MLYLYTDFIYNSKHDVVKREAAPIRIPCLCPNKKEKEEEEKNGLS